MSADATERTLSSPVRQTGAHLSHRITVLASADAAAIGRRVMLEGALSIGRVGHVTGPLALADRELSRVHAELSPEAGTGTWWVADGGSRNGTFVAGGRTERAGLVDQDVVRLGATVLLYERLELTDSSPLEPLSRPPLLGTSVAIARARAEIGRVATRDLPVLVLGETGTGKELAFEALHERSDRTGDAIALNCGALPADLVESELFGHAAGAFTGAARARDGLFVAADGGTLFLDEIGELPLALQPKLLRVLSVGEVRPGGATEARRVDVRVVAATHRDLRAAVEAETFRGDLYARLCGWTIELPPLRARREDVLELARPFLASDGAPSAIGADAAEALLLYAWPFNVRELKQVCAQIAVRAEGAEKVELEHLPQEIAAPIVSRQALEVQPSAPPLALSVRPDSTPTKDELARVVAHFEGNLARVAGFFGRDRKQVYRWLDRYGLR